MINEHGVGGVFGLLVRLNVADSTAKVRRVCKCTKEKLKLCGNSLARAPLSPAEADWTRSILQP